MGVRGNLSEEATGIPNFDQDSDQDQMEALDLYSKLRDTKAKLIGSDGKPQVLPGNLDSFLLTLLADVLNGGSVTILQRDTTLTTVEAAKFLGVSRQFLVQEIDKERIPHHKVGTHRRLYVRDVLGYKSKRDASRRKNLDDLALAEYEEGLYEKSLNDSDT